MFKTVGDLIEELEKFPKDMPIRVDKFETKYSLSDKWDIESVGLDEININNSTIPFVKITLYDAVEQMLLDCKCENRQNVYKDGE